jgi:hypothetical protein
MSLEVTIHGVGVGTCSLTGKECDGLTVSFSDGTLEGGFLSQKAFMQLIKMKLRAASIARPSSPHGVANANANSPNRSQ